MCVRDTSRQWEVSCEPGTSSRLIVIPRSLIDSNAIRHIRTNALCFDVQNPEAQFILNYIELFEAERRRTVSPQRDRVVQDGLATLISSLIRRDREHTESGFDNLTVASARKIIEAHLLDDELSPSLIAKELAISLRNLHRSFARIGISVMDEVRQLRLQGAHDDLVSSDRSTTVSDIAAKWKFSDASHFVRRFKSKYGETPASYRAEVRRRAEHKPMWPAAGS
nr:helix-turn-helix domain-containing protein [Streptomyces sp. ok210]